MIDYSRASKRELETLFLRIQFTLQNFEPGDINKKEWNNLHEFGRKIFNEIYDRKERYEAKHGKPD